MSKVFVLKTYNINIITRSFFIIQWYLATFKYTKYLNKYNKEAITKINIEHCILLSS